MNILISGATSEIALKVIESMQGYNFYGLTRDKNLNSNLYNKLWGIDNYNSLELKNLFNQIENISFDGLILFNGFQSPSLLSSFREKNFDEAININFKIPMIVINEVLKSKKYTENFNVCLIGSIASQVNEVGNAYYGLSKKILEHSTKILAKELKQKKVRVNCLNIGLVETQMSQNILKKIPEKNRIELLAKQGNQYVEIQQIASSIATLLSNKAINGENINIDNGYSL
jgi:short-subunit dehydrogenase